MEFILWLHLQNVTASSGFCTQYCGWHSTELQHQENSLFIRRKQNVVYLHVLHNQPLVPMQIGRWWFNFSFLTHELEETNSDPVWTLGMIQVVLKMLTNVLGHSDISNSKLQMVWANMTFGGRNWLISATFEIRVQVGSVWLIQPITKLNLEKQN